MFGGLILKERGVSVWKCLVPLAVLSTIFTVGCLFAVPYSPRTPRTSEVLWGIEFRLILALWVSIDRQIRGFNVPFEFDGFVFFIWPFLVPYYLYRTRGGRGILIVTSIYVLYLTPYVVAQIARVVR